VSFSSVQNSFTEFWSWCSHSCNNEKYRLLGYNAVKSARSSSMFRRELPTSSVSKQQTSKIQAVWRDVLVAHTDSLLNTADGGSTLLRSFGWYRKCDRAMFLNYFYEVPFKNVFEVPQVGHLKFSNWRLFQQLQQICSNNLVVTECSESITCRP
jgi:hypothetical protein